MPCCVLWVLITFAGVKSFIWCVLLIVCAFQEDPALPRVLLFSEKKDTSALYKKLSMDFHRSAVFGQALSTDAKVVKQFGVTKFPAVFVSGPGPHDPKAESFTWKQYEGV